MKAEAKNKGRPRPSAADIRLRCSSLKLESHCDYEDALLAMLYRVLFDEQCKKFRDALTAKERLYNFLRTQIEHSDEMPEAISITNKMK